MGAAWASSPDPGTQPPSRLCPSHPDPGLRQLQTRRPHQARLGPAEPQTRASLKTHFPQNVYLKSLPSVLTFLLTYSPSAVPGWAGLQKPLGLQGREAGVKVRVGPDPATSTLWIIPTVGSGQPLCGPRRAEPWQGSQPAVTQESCGP